MTINNNCTSLAISYNSKTLEEVKTIFENSFSTFDGETKNTMKSILGSTHNRITPKFCDTIYNTESAYIEQIMIINEYKYLVKNRIVDPFRRSKQGLINIVLDGQSFSTTKSHINFLLFGVNSGFFNLINI
jgi:hypothetical protein